jgi:Protein HRI1
MAAPAPPQANISKRISIRWLTDPPHEPTSTLVLTSPSGTFVDLRIHTATSSSSDSSAALDWAFAGQASYAPSRTHPGCSEGAWTHWVDSNVATGAEADEDRGVMTPLERKDGDGGARTLERGVMRNEAAGGDVQRYEEVWEDVAVAGTGKGNEVRCVVARYRGDEEVGGGVARGVVVLLGRVCQGVLRVGAEVTAERWEYGGDDGDGAVLGTKEWRRVFGVGTGSLPCGAVCRESVDLRLGEEFQLPLSGGMRWKVAELEVLTQS